MCTTSSRILNGSSMADVRIVDLDDVVDSPDNTVVTLQLVEMHGESHRRWRITPSAGGSWNYEKA